LNFGIALFVGSSYGSAIRDEVSFHSVADVSLEEARARIEVERLIKYVELLKLKHDYEEKYKLDLSKFSSAYERAADQSK
jgi:hypothetical protein